MATTQYATLSDVKAWLGITTTDQDDNLNQVIPVASRMIDRHCRRRFWIDDLVSDRVFTAEFADLLTVPDIATDTGIVVKTDTTNDGSYDQTWTENSRTTWGYRLEPVNAQAETEDIADEPYTSIVVLAGSFPSGKYAVQVTAKYGWPAVPEDIETATVMLAARIWKRKDAILGVAGGPEVGITELAKRMDPDIKRLLDPYRVLTIGAVG